MNKEQQRIKIAEACGWKENHDQGWGKPNIYDDDEPLVYWHAHELPDYPNDLNAMHEAEKLLPRQLNHIDYWQKGYGRFQMLLAAYTITPYSATAAQRAEAFLKTLNLWTDE
jgi:hypothetical protein